MQSAENMTRNQQPNKATVEQSWR